MLVSTPIRYLTPYGHSRHTLSILSTRSHVYHHSLFHLLIVALFYLTSYPGLGSSYSGPHVYNRVLGLL